MPIGAAEASVLGSTVVGAPQIPPKNPLSGSTLVRDVALYSAARLALVAVLALILVLAGVPLLVAVLLALVVALPLSMVLLRSLRIRVNTGMAAAGARRRSERDRLRNQLRGEQDLR